MTTSPLPTDMSAYITPDESLLYASRGKTSASTESPRAAVPWRYSSPSAFVFEGGGLPSTSAKTGLALELIVMPIIPLVVIFLRVVRLSVM